MADYIFISYAHEDIALCYTFCSEIQDSGYSIWVDKHLKVGTTWENTIFSKIDNCQAFIFLATKNSTQSEFCRRECAYAVEKGKFIVPVKLAPCQLPPEIKHIQWLDDGKTNGINLDIDDPKSFQIEYRRLALLAKDTRHVLWDNIGVVHPNNQIGRLRKTYRNLQQLDACSTHFYYLGDFRRLANIRNNLRHRRVENLLKKYWDLVDHLFNKLEEEFLIDWLRWDRIPREQDYYHRRHDISREDWDQSGSIIDSRLNDFEKFVDDELKKLGVK